MRRQQLTAGSVPSKDLMVLLGLLSAFGPLSMDMYLPGLPAVEDDLGAGQAAAQLTLTAAALGLAAGQLVAGPLSDRFGRRAPLLIGLVAYAVASVLCALAPSIWVLVGVRLLQGMAGAAGIALSRAIVRDCTEGLAAARAFAVLASINGVAPVLAPVAGGQLLRVTDWRGVFAVLTAIGAVLLVWSATRLPETLPRSDRTGGGVRATLATGRVLLGQRAFLGPVLAFGLGFGALFTYISTSSFVLQDGFGLSPAQFSLLFALNGAGIVAAGQASRVLVARAGPRRLVLAGLLLQSAAAAVLVTAALAGWGLPVVVPALLVNATAFGLVAPNATTLAMSGARQVAGSASALLGISQFALGGLIAPLAGLGPSGELLPMAVVMAGSALAATGVFLLVRERTPAVPVPTSEVPA
ncbi:multidrug effflux MFS transporter [Modestobacter sp. NPDC049651]|uniref:multidrug effflux MFS transporter n=1 Tax=unclassified Modestobacter TaxID=2643866 RepID=UPI0033DEA103